MARSIWLRCRKRAAYHQRLHALDLATGAELFSGPKEITASFPGTGDNTDGTNVIFDPKQYKERMGLLLLNGVIYTAWASHCDFSPYTAWVMGHDADTLAPKSVLNVVPNGSLGAFWSAGGGIAADPQGNIYLLVRQWRFRHQPEWQRISQQQKFRQCISETLNDQRTSWRLRIILKCRTV